MSREMGDIKITVLRRFDPVEVFEKSPVTRVITAPFGKCQRLEDDQEFIVGSDGNMPAGFCTSAWVSIYPNVRLLRFGGNNPNLQEKGVVISCCNDGLRPVIFKLERV